MFLLQTHVLRRLLAALFSVYSVTAFLVKRMGITTS